MSQNAPQKEEKITKEIRFAVVMYGGVSLAIYMNGIAQELLYMVRATAGNPQEKMASSKTKGTVSVYKELAEYLSEHVTPLFKHKFVVDIISGTSAGGINGVCLAKGLVKGLDNLKALEKMWLDEGDLSKLLNDKSSDLGLFCSKEPKTSLLNSQRMYAKLFEAFKNMEDSATEKSNNGKGARSLVDSLDLFVTATDLRGLQLPIQLSDGNTYEHIHKFVFPFKYRREQPNHFTSGHDPLLAFASRCTSSFPTAFEPVKLADLHPLLKKELSKKDYLKFKNNLNHWKKEFFRGYEITTDAIELEEREFADGGYLDNRPFGHAIQAIHEREYDCPLERKLLFIDPAPESKKTKQKKKDNEISFIENTKLAAIDLPGYETIREEINFLQKRNRWINSTNQILETLRPINTQRLNTIILEKYLFYSKQKIERTTFAQTKAAKTNKESDIREIRQYIESLDLGGQPLTFMKTNSLLPFMDPNLHFFSILPNSDNTYQDSFLEKLVDPQKRDAIDKDIFECLRFPNKDMKEMVRLYGDGYPPFHYAKIEKITDFITLVISRASNIKEQSADHQAIRMLVYQWRKSTFLRDKIKEKKTENIFIERYDIDFHIRRLIYLRKLLEDTLLSGTDLDGIQTKVKPGNNIEAQNLHKTIVNALKRLYRIKKKLLLFGNENPLANSIDSLTNKLQRKNVELSRIYQHLSKENNTKALSDDFSSLIEQVVPESSRADFEREFNSLMTKISNFIHQGLPEELPEDPMGSPPKENLEGTDAIKKEIETAISQFSKTDLLNAVYLLFLYYYGYDLHEITTFQLFAGGEYGEGTNIDIHRISPLDAINLWDDENNKKAKLAGISLSAFGGFLDREWRRNDIMWGRLDGAERLISALIPDHKDKQIITVLRPNEKYSSIKKRFIDKAQLTIVSETIAEWLKELECPRFTSTRSEEHYRRLLSIKDGLERPNTRIIKAPKENLENEKYLSAFSIKCFKQRSLKSAEALIKWVKPEFAFRNLGATINESVKPTEQQHGPQWKKVFRDKYEFHRDMEPEPSLRYLGRASGIASSMIDRLDPGEGITKKISSYLKKLNWILLGLLDFSTPKTFKGILFSYWMHLFVLVSTVIIIGSYLISLPNIFRAFGIGLLIISLFILIFKCFLTVTVHKITCSRIIRSLASVIIFFSLTGLFFVLIALYDAVLNHGTDFISAFGAAFGQSWEKVTGRLVQLFKGG